MQHDEFMQVLYIFGAIFAALTTAIGALVSALIYFSKRVADSVDKVPAAIGSVHEELKKQTTRLDSIEFSNDQIVKGLAGMKFAK